MGGKGWEGWWVGGGGESVWFQFRAHYKVSLLERKGDRRMMTLPFLAGGNFEDKIYVLEFWRGNKKMSLA